MRFCFREGNSPVLMRTEADAGPLIERAPFKDDQSKPGDGGEDQWVGRPLPESMPATIGRRLPPNGTVEDPSGDGRAAGILGRIAAGLAKGVRGFFWVLLILLFSSWFHGIAPMAVAAFLLKLDHPIVVDILLALPFAMLVLTASIVALARSSAGAGEGVESAELDAYQVAVLAGGAEFATTAAIASLVHRGILGLDAGDRRLSLRADQPTGSHPLEDAIRSAIEPETGRGLAEVRSAARPTAGRLREGLVRRGLILSEARSGAVDCMAFLSIFCGLPGCWVVGIWTGYYVVAMAIHLCYIMATFGLAKVGDGRTRDGDKVLNDLKGRYAVEDPLPGPGEERVYDSRLVLALALLDRSSLPDGELAELWDALDPAGAGDDSAEADGADGDGADAGGD